MGDRPDFYREIALGLVRLAAMVMDPDVKGELIETAMQFERLANYVSRRDRCAPPTSAPSQRDNF